MLEKTYNAAECEPRIAARWREADAFRAGAGSAPGADPFCIVIPPPNVTGSLHMGHALNCTLQDVLARFERMRGRDVLWQPGMDHAGIATQMVVERRLADAGLDRRALGREAFVGEVWEWKAESGGAIARQLRRLGASCDFSRERFTMDEGLSRAVVEVFVTLYRQGLVYRDTRLVNWDPKLLTAISDLEVEQVETDGRLWHLRFTLEEGFTYEHPVRSDGGDGPLAWETRDHLVVATTRPETMFGDTGIAVHPDDERYRPLVGRHAILPLVGRRLPIVADPYPDPNVGTGAVKITPAHDFNDFEVGKRAGLRAVNVMTRDGRLALRDNAAFLEGLPESPTLAQAVDDCDGIERFEARKRIVERLRKTGLVERVDDHRHQVPHGDRSRAPVEPFLTEQWYVDAGALAQPAIDAVREGRVRFVPEIWEKTYFEWMENIRPWCVSRQLWWGHRIPAWYGPDGAVFVERDETQAHAAAELHYGAPAELVRDEDVLDTWFSSALWPFSTLGWPDRTPELARYYPNEMLITGFDIIFFWVARMMMMGLHLVKDADGVPLEPFRTVYVHALVRDRLGAKMSKSKGNVIDPLDLMDEYGADALRFTLASMASPGRDVKLDPQRVAGSRNFATKLWNAARFAEMNGVAPNAGFDPGAVRLAANRWVLGELARTVREATACLEACRFDEAAAAVYRFVWDRFCDWYLELLKPVLGGDDETAKCEARATAAYALDRICRLLHPFMPFMTEELWDMAPGRDGLLCHAAWPDPAECDPGGENAAGEIDWLIALVSGIRSVRAEMNVPAATLAPLIAVGASGETSARLGRHHAAIARLARVESVTAQRDVPSGCAQIVVGEATFCLPLGSVIDLGAERARLEKSLDRITAELARTSTRMGNEKFLARARPEVIETERERLAELTDRRIRLELALCRLDEAR